MHDPAEEKREPDNPLYVTLAVLFFLACILGAGTQTLSGFACPLLPIFVCGGAFYGWRAFLWLVRWLSRRGRSVADVWQHEWLPPAPPSPLPPPPAPPPPTKADVLAEARARYEAAILMLDDTGLGPAELRAAKEKVKRKYLKELDGLL